ncbi:MAG TPA: tetratricopeptide repeat protein [bacterium]|nr:tetratricopeptide repeat protein [bacterium]
MKKNLKIKVLAAAFAFLVPFALTASPLTPEEWINRGNSLYKQGLFSGALISYKKALKLNPENYAANLYAGMACVKTGDKEASVIYLSKAHSVKPSARTENLLAGLGAGPSKDGHFGINENRGFIRPFIKAGAMHSSMDDSQNIISGIFSFTGGAGIMLSFGSPFSFQTEVLYVQRGGEQDGKESGKIKYSFDYIELPVYFKISIVPYPKYILSTMLGASAGLNTRAVFSALDGTADYSSEVQKMNYGLMAGGQSSYPMGNGRLFVEARFYYGLSDIFISESFSGYYRDISLIMGYLF